MAVVERTVCLDKDEEEEEVINSSSIAEEEKPAAPSAEVQAAAEAIFGFKGYDKEIYAYLKKHQVGCERVWGFKQLC